MNGSSGTCRLNLIPLHRRPRSSSHRRRSAMVNCAFRSSRARPIVFLLVRRRCESMEEDDIACLMCVVAPHPTLLQNHQCCLQHRIWIQTDRINPRPSRSALRPAGLLYYFLRMPFSCSRIIRVVFKTVSGFNEMESMPS